MDKVLVLGKGYVSDHLNYSKYYKRIDPLNIDFNDILKEKPDIIINCIGKTGRPNIDSLENDKENTYLTNTVLPAKLAHLCLQHGIYFINIGSGCIYYGKSPNIENSIDIGWKELDYPNPIAYYSKTKYACDLMIGDLDVTTLRIRMPISCISSHRNFIDKVSKYDKIIDIQNSMTFMEDFVKCVDFFAKNKLKGIYNVTNPGSLSALDILNEYKKYKNLSFSVISEKELDQLTVVKRSNCFLNTEKLNKVGFYLKDSKLALIDCMKEYFKNSY